MHCAPWLPWHATVGEDDNWVDNLLFCVSGAVLRSLYLVSNVHYYNNLSTYTANAQSLNSRLRSIQYCIVLNKFITIINYREFFFFEGKCLATGIIMKNHNE